jgi:predicted nuclease with TOPRIM domain
LSLQGGAAGGPPEAVKRDFLRLGEHLIHRACLDHPAEYHADFERELDNAFLEQHAPGLESYQRRRRAFNERRQLSIELRRGAMQEHRELRRKCAELRGKLDGGQEVTAYLDAEIRNVEEKTKEMATEREKRKQIDRAERCGMNMLQDLVNLIDTQNRELSMASGKK